MTYIAVAAIVAILLACWVAYVPGRYPLPESPTTHLCVATMDGWTLDVYLHPAKDRRFREPVILCHGLGSNHTIFEFAEPWNLAKFLSDSGFDCYSVNLRGVRSNATEFEGPYDVSFDDYVGSDAPALLKRIQDHSGSPQVLWVGHSMGGLVGLAVAGGTLGSAFKALVTIGSPAYFRTSNASVALIRVGRWLAPWGVFNSGLVKFLAPLAGLVPLSDHIHSANLRNLSVHVQQMLLANTIVRIFRGVLDQLDDWISHDAFRSRDRTLDYRTRIAEIICPTLVVGGSVDMLCPEYATRALAEGLAKSRQTLTMFGRKYGHLDDYGHGDLVVGARANSEVYPVLSRFLRSNATAADTARGTGALAPPLTLPVEV